MARCPDCGREVDGLEREVTFGVPDAVFAIAPEEQPRRVLHPAKSFLLLDGSRSFLRVLLPVMLDIGHEFRFGVWIEVDRSAAASAWASWDSADYMKLSIDGLLANSVPPWGTRILGSPCHAGPRNQSDTLYIDSSSDSVLSGVLTTPWSTHECEQVIRGVWGDQQPGTA